MLNKKSFVSLIIILALSGCGFKLRGIIEVPEYLKRLHLTTATHDRKMISETTRALASNGITIVSKADQAPYTLDILNQETQKRQVAISSNFRDAEEYELRTQLTYEIRGSDGFRLIMPTTITTERTFTNNENQVRAKAREEEALLADMRRDLIQQMLRQIQALKSRLSTADGQQ